MTAELSSFDWVDWVLVILDSIRINEYMMMMWGSEQCTATGYRWAQKSIVSSMGNWGGGGRERPSGEVNRNMRAHCCCHSYCIKAAQRLDSQLYIAHWGLSHMCTPTETHIFTWSQPGCVTIQMIHKEIISSGAATRTEECDSVIFWMIGWQLAM